MAVTELTDKNPDGTRVGQSVSDLVAFWGSTPTSQQAAAIMTGTSSLFVLTGASFVANTTSTVSGLFGFNSTFVVQLIDALQEIRSALVEMGLHKGGA
jgi:hypothetical protein